MKRMHGKLLKKAVRLGFCAFKWSTLTGCILTVILYLYVVCGSFPEELLEKGDFTSIRIVDCNGLLLREILSDRQGRSRWLDHEEFSPYLVNATIAVEDKRFYRHGGVDFVAIGRAAWDNLRHRRVVSGASTLTQQLVRILRPRRRTLWTKADEAVLAMRLERRLGKKEILTYYLNRAPYGNQLFGAQCASQVYFAKPAGDLSLAEAAFIAGLPQAPSRYNPYRHKQRAVTRQRQVLQCMLRNSMVTPRQHKRALSEKLKLVPKEHAFRAPHFIEYLRPQLPQDTKPATITTTLDMALQSRVESITSSAVDRLAGKNITNAAVVVLENRNARILAMVGSADFFDIEHNGQVNGALAVRQPGSTLKPFAYALALERGFTPASVVADVPHTYGSGAGTYTPTNYDRRFYGPVRLRVALANSLNVPAVAAVNRAGLRSFWTKLKDLGFQHVDRTPDEYGLGLALGNAGVTLLELAGAYSTLARKGNCLTPSPFFKPIQGRPEREVFSEDTCFMISDILRDRAASRMAFGHSGVFVFPFSVAVKTGTSHDSRDNWALAYTPEHTVAVWVGNFNCEPLRQSSGITGAGPILRDVIHALYADSTPTWFETPAGIVECEICALSGCKAGAGCPCRVREYFHRDAQPSEQCRLHGEECTVHLGRLDCGYRRWLADQGMETEACSSGDLLSITSPANREVFVIDPDVERELQTITLRCDCPPEEVVTWHVDGKKFVSARGGDVRWQLQRGRHVFGLTDSRGRTCPTVTINIE